MFWTFVTALVDRLGAKILSGMLGSILVTICVLGEVFPVQPTFFEFSTVIGTLLGVPVGLRVKEKSKSNGS